MGRRSDVCGGEGAWGEEVTYVEGDVCEHCAHTPAHRANVSMLNWNGKEGRSEEGREEGREGGRVYYKPQMPPATIKPDRA